MRYFYILTVMIFLLSGCTTETEIEEITGDEIELVNEKSEPLMNQETVSLNQEDVSLLEEVTTEKVNENVDKYKEDSEANIESFEKVETVIEKENNSNSLIVDIENNSYFDYFYAEKDESIKVEILDEKSLVLPTIENNEETFTDDVITITFEDLKNDEIVNLVPEPLVEGYMAIFDLEKLYKKYSGVSYSVFFKEQEYGIIVFKDSSDIGVTVLIEEDLTEESVFSEAILKILK